MKSDSAQPTPDFPSTIVVPMVSGIGNALMTQPMVRVLRGCLPRVRVVVLALTRAMAEPFERLHDPGTETRVTGKGTRGIARLVRESRRLLPDAFVVPFPSNRWQYNALAASSGAKQVILHAYPADHRAMFYNTKATRVPAVRGVHDVLQNLSLLEPLGVKVPAGVDVAPRFEVSDDELEKARALLNHDDTPFVVIHAGSAKSMLAQAKRWPPESYARLIDGLCTLDDRRVVLVEGPDEQGIGRSILSFSRHASSSGRFSILSLACPLGVSAAVLKRASLYVGTDSGLAHLAAAVGTPTVTLFAPADPSRVCPFGHEHGVIQPERACSPCFMYPWESTRPRMKCRAPFCIETITPDRVLTRVLARVRETA